jgi:hypothetical protein
MNGGEKFRRSDDPIYPEFSLWASEGRQWAATVIKMIEP